MKNICILLVMITSLVGGCSTTPGFGSHYESQKGSLAELTSYKVGNGFIAIEIIGYGCTFQQDFKVKAVSDEDNMIEIIRTREDACKMKPRNVALSYSFKHLKLDTDKPVKVLNQTSESEYTNFAVK